MDGFTMNLQCEYNRRIKFINCRKRRLHTSLTTHSKRCRFLANRSEEAKSPCGHWQKKIKIFFRFAYKNADFFASRSEGTKNSLVILDNWIDGMPRELPILPEWASRQARPPWSFSFLPITAGRDKRATNCVLSRAVFSIVRQGDDRDSGEQWYSCVRRSSQSCKARYRVSDWNLCRLIDMWSRFLCKSPQKNHAAGYSAFRIWIEAPPLLSKWGQRW